MHDTWDMIQATEENDDRKERKKKNNNNKTHSNKFHPHFTFHTHWKFDCNEFFWKHEWRHIYYLLYEYVEDIFELWTNTRQRDKGNVKNCLDEPKIGSRKFSYLYWIVWIRFYMKFFKQQFHTRSSTTALNLHECEGNYKILLRLHLSETITWTYFFDIR